MRVISSNANPTIIMQQIDKKIAASKEQGAPSARSTERVFKDLNVTISGEAMLKQRVSGTNDPRLDASVLGKAKYDFKKENSILTSYRDKRMSGDTDKEGPAGAANKVVKPKEITLESLAADIRQAFMKAISIKGFPRLFDVLFKDRR
ncbi:hypothetical protein KDX38_24150 [Pseudomonas sp. CDFA 602]|uniref:hypothetical protein n=1 Tax=Pseudomonas californiensis TaxID=2829823 RepID=UPI001E659E27|nr:hypothetical protein [Pseudomonas californiensis]MCD5996647.1 hypothetical protein [Pseudomonas californiensis]MCD6002282.1 hypothetical protein [Pseudomonas californiensis]